VDRQEIIARSGGISETVAGTVAIAALPSQTRAQAGVKEIRIGYQKNGRAVIARQHAALESISAHRASMSNGWSSRRGRR